MLLENDGTCKLSSEEFDVLLSRAERARDLLAGGAALLRETDGREHDCETVANLLATARVVVAAIVGDLEGALARAHEQRRVHGQALKHVAPAVSR
jgi:hypothetical protein